MRRWRRHRSHPSQECRTITRPLLCATAGVGYSRLGLRVTTLDLEHLLFPRTLVRTKIRSRHRKAIANCHIKTEKKSEPLF